MVGEAGPRNMGDARQVNMLRLMRLHFGYDLSTRSGRALVEEHYWSLRRQAPIV
jgi:hypothetical protein